MSSDLTALFKYCLNVLRTESITGQKALKALGYFLYLKLLEPKIGVEIDFENFDGYRKLSISEREDLMPCTKLSYFSTFKDAKKKERIIDEDNIPLLFDKLWTKILSKHHTTKIFFPSNKKIGIKLKSTYIKIIDRINSFNFEKIDHDILGAAYEEVIQDLMTGKVLGQYFTPTKIKNMMIQLVRPKLFEDGTCETIYDPAMGTGGFLISSIRYYMKQAKENNIEINWDFVTSGAINGRDPEVDTFDFAMSNMLISTGHIFQLENDDSIRNPTGNSYRILLANPPFGIDGLKFEELLSANLPFEKREMYFPIPSSNAVSLFLQLMIYILDINGRCAVVLPNGKENNSKTDQSLIMLRKFLMKTCDLKRVIYLPSGVFEHTSITTSVFYFEKRKHGNQVFNQVKKESKKKKIVNPFVDENYETTEVIFSNFNVESGEIEDIITVGIEKLKEKSYSLNSAEYIDNSENQYENDIVIKPLSEICEDISTSKNIASSKRVDGSYRFFTCSREESTHNKYHYDGTYIIHGSRGSTIKESIFMTYQEKFSIGTSMFISKIKNDEECLIKYLYYYLNLNQDIFIPYVTGSAIPMITKTDYYRILIPIPRIEMQKQIIEYLDFLFENIQTSEKKIQELKCLNKYFVRNQIQYSKNQSKTLKEVCDFQNGFAFKSNQYEQQNKDNIGIIQIKSIQNGFIDQDKITEYMKEDKKYKLFEIQKGDLLVALTGATTGKIGLYQLEHKSYLNQRIAKITTKGDLIQKYFYYWYIYSNKDEEILHLAQGTAQPNISTNDISKINIQFPSLKRQMEIIEYCDQNESLIQQLESNIEDSKRIAHEYLNMVLHISEEDPSIPIEETVEPVVSALQMIEEAREEAGVREEVSTESVVDAFLQETMQEAAIVIPKKKKKKVLPKSSSSE